MSDRTFLDTNVVVYLYDADAPTKQAQARRLLEADGGRGGLVVSTQVLQEFYTTVTRKLGHPLPEKAAEEATRALAEFEVVTPDAELVLEAIALARKDKLSLWDALIVRSALKAGCDALFSEDLQDGRRWGRLRVENPFRPL